MLESERVSWEVAYVEQGLQVEMHLVYRHASVNPERGKMQNWHVEMGSKCQIILGTREGKSSTFPYIQILEQIKK